MDKRKPSGIALSAILLAGTLTVFGAMTVVKDVQGLTSCTPPPAGMVSWWPLDGNTANLPCNGGSGPTSGSGNDSPDLKIVAGVIGGPVGDVIGSAAQDTGFVGPNNTCVFHGTFSPTGKVTTITDIVLINARTSHVKLPEGATVTITGTYT